MGQYIVPYFFIILTFCIIFVKDNKNYIFLQMTKITYRTILVIGDNHADIARKYSADLKGNENAYYKYERCQQHRLDVTGEEGDFSDPFPLKNGGKAYSARFNDIDWEKIHKNPRQMELSKRAWEIIVEGSEPVNEQERYLKARMKHRISYFTDNFATKEVYMQYYSSLWYYGVATEEKYEEVDTWNSSILEWCINFFDKFLKGLEETNPLITIYETHSLD